MDTKLQQRATAGDVGAQWDLNLKAATTIATTATCKALKLRKLERRIFPGVNRRMDLVSPDLLGVLRDLATGKRPWPLFLHGSSGSGKTAAALALCDFARSAVYWTADDLADFIMANSGDAVQGEWDRIIEKDLAVLDEIGERAAITDLAYRTVKKFADVRECQAHRVAIYASNLSPGEVHRHFDDRVASRLLCGSVFHLIDKDRRFSSD